jgi:hypothetical protein
LTDGLKGGSNNDAGVAVKMQKKEGRGRERRRRGGRAVERERGIPVLVVAESLLAGNNKIKKIK